MTKPWVVKLVLAAFAAFPACGSAPSGPPHDAASRHGARDRELPMPAEARASHEAAYAVERAHLDANPDDADALVAVGRRLGALGRMSDAVALFEDGTRRFADDARMFRHLGHRYVSVRRFADAERTLEHAADLVRGQDDVPEPGLVPNAQGLVIDTLQLNVFYHLALARHFQGDFDGAADAWRECVARAANPDALCSTTNWLCASLLRAGRRDEAKAALARIAPDLAVVEYHAYLTLCRVYQGAIDGDAALAAARAKGAESTDFATIAYGVGNWHCVEGREARALEVWREAAAAPMWAAFGCIGAEVELARRGQR